MNIKKFIKTSTLLIFLLSSNLFGNKEGPHRLFIAEQDLKVFMKEAIPLTQQIKIPNLQEKINLESFQEQYRPTLFIGGNHTRTREKTTNSYFPVYSPINTGTIGVRKNFKRGLNFEFKAGVDDRTYQDSTKKLSQVFFSSSIELDLWKNFLGRISLAKEKDQIMSKRLSSFNEEISLHQNFLKARKIYWNWIVQNESLKIIDSLLKASLRIKKDAQERFHNKLLDKGELAKVNSLVANRRSQKVQYQYQIDQYVNELKKIFPQLTSKNLALKSYSISFMQKQVFQCTAHIKDLKGVPKEYTYCDDIISLLDKQFSEREKVNKWHDALDLKFTAKGSSQGRDSNFSDAIEISSLEKKFKGSVGLQLSIPLGNTLTKTKKTIYNLHKTLWQSEKVDLLNQMQATHQTILKNIARLNNVVEIQGHNLEQLKISKAVMEQKFKQARVLTNDLVREEFDYLEAELKILETKKIILFTLFDYFAIFTKTPCDINIML